MNKSNIQTILGSGGVIGNELAKSLSKYTSNIRLVARNPKKINENNELIQADLRNFEEVIKAVENSEIVYLTVGLKYDVNVWQKDWKNIMQNVITACKVNCSKLVFFDNVYMYGLVNGKMTEETPINPISKKGEVRAEIAEMILNEIKKGELTAQIVRAADFLGLISNNSFANIMIIDKLKSKKKAMLVLNDSKKHSYTFTPDAAKATALLGNTDSAYNQIWHLPTNSNTLSGKEFVELTGKVFGVEAKYQILSRFLFNVIALFNSAIKESKEMLYQFEYDYIFDSSKFDKAFPEFKKNSYSEALQLIKNYSKN